MTAQPPAPRQSDHRTPTLVTKASDDAVRADAIRLRQAMRAARRRRAIPRVLARRAG